MPLLKCYQLYNESFSKASPPHFTQFPVTILLHKESTVTQMCPCTEHVVILIKLSDTNMAIFFLLTWL